MDQFPRTTEGIAAWLATPAVEMVEGVRRWHGDAAVVRAMEDVEALPIEERAPAFFHRINAIQRRRKRAGDWPSMMFRAWRVGAGW